MYLEVYPDIIFILNFFLDLIILQILKKISRKKSSVGRRIAGACVGALAAVLLGIFPWMNIILRFIIINVVASVLMLLLAFGTMKVADLIKQAITLYLITYVLGGLINSIYYYTNMRLHLIHFGNSIIFSNISGKFIMVIAILLLPVLVLLIWLYRVYHSRDREVYDVELIYQKGRIITRGFFDSGNCLYDPIFKKPVIIIENSLLNELLTPEQHRVYELLRIGTDPSEADPSGKECQAMPTLSLRMIPYQSIGKQHGIMPGLVLDKVLIHKGTEIRCNEKVTAAICDNRLSTREEYHIILHKDLI